MKGKNILIFGATGMIGRTVFRYLQSLYPETVWGTTRNETEINAKKLLLTVENYQDNFAQIKKRVKYVDLIINCIGILKDTCTRKELIIVNALFPHQLEELVEKYGCKLIHISTDAVFSPLVGKVNESSSPSPVDYYGNSKLLGETVSKNAITFRSSFIGFNPAKRKGLLEQVRQQKGTFYGYTNQIWTGCTALQFAKLCKQLAADKFFIKLRKISPVYHFAPIGPISKYKLVKTFTKIDNGNYSLKKISNTKINRILTTNYIRELAINNYTNDSEKAIKELIEFEERFIGL